MIGDRPAGWVEVRAGLGPNARVGGEGGCGRRATAAEKRPWGWMDAGWRRDGARTPGDGGVARERVIETSLPRLFTVFLGLLISAGCTFTVYLLIDNYYDGEETAKKEALVREGEPFRRAASELDLLAKAEASAPELISEQEGFTVTLIAPGANRVNVIKAIREATSLGLKEAKDLVDGLADGVPTLVKAGLSKEEAIEIKESYRCRCNRGGVLQEAVLHALRPLDVARCAHQYIPQNVIDIALTEAQQGFVIGQTDAVFDG